MAGTTANSDRSSQAIRVAPSAGKTTLAHCKTRMVCRRVLLAGLLVAAGVARAPAAHAQLRGSTAAGEQQNSQTVPHPANPVARSIAPEETGETPLHVAASQGQAAEVLRLLQSGADVDARSAKGATPLHLAAANGHMAALALLLARDAAVNAKTKDGYTPLFFSVARKQVPVSTALLQAGADPDIANDFGETPLHAAASEGHAQLVSLLLAYGANVKGTDKQNAAAIHFAASSPGYQPVVRWLLDHGADVNQATAEGLTPLHLAAVSGNIEVIRFLVAGGARLDSTDAHGRTPLALAAVSGNAAVVEFLAGSGASVDPVDTDGATPLLRAMERPDTQVPRVVAVLLDHGANPNARNQEGLTPLLLAVRDGNEALAKLLADKGASLEAGLDDLGVSPLLLAAVNGKESMVRFLVGRGADIRARTKGGYSALVLSLTAGHAPIAEYLIQQGIDVNAQGTADHVTALFVAAHKGQEALVRLILRNKADANVRLDDGRTPLTAALGSRYIAVAEQLVNAGAREDFERDPTTAVFADIVKARSSGNQRRYEQVVLRGGFFSFNVAAMYVDEALARRAQGDDEGGFLDIAEGIATIHANALGTDEFARVVKGYTLMNRDECKERLVKTKMLADAHTAVEEGKVDVAQRLGEEALNVFDKSGDQLSRFRAFVLLAQTYYAAGWHEKADLYERKIDLLLSQWGYTRLDKARVILGGPSPKGEEKEAGPSDAQRSGFVVADLDLLPGTDVPGKADADALRKYQAMLAATSQDVSPARAHMLLDAARVARRLHQFGHASFYYSQAYRHLLQVGDKEGALMAQLGLADLLSEVGRSREAVDYYSRALKTARDTGSDARKATTAARAEIDAIIASRLGNLFSLDSDQVRAIEYYEQALIQLHKPDSLEEAVLLMNIGTVYARAGKVQEALHYYRPLLDAWKERNPSLAAKVRVNMALALHAAGKDSDAWTQIEALTSLDSAQPDPELSWRAERTAALIQQSMSHADLAANRYASAIRQLDDIDARAGDLEQAAKTHILERRRFVYREYLDLLVEMAARHPDEGYEARVLELSEKLKSRIVTDMVARSNAALASPGVASRLGVDRARELEVSRFRAELDAALQQPRRDRDEDKIESLRAQIQSAEQAREDERARVGQSQRDKLIASLARIRPAAEMQGFLTRGEVVISYAVGVRSVIALVVTKDRLRLVQLPTNPGELESLITHFRSGLDDVADWQDLERFDPVTAYHLYEKILKPVAGYLTRGSHIVVCGDELLYSVPLEALVDEPLTEKDFAAAREKARSGVGDYLSEYAGLHYVIDSHVISYLPSVSVLALLRERQEGPARHWKRPLVAFGDPVFKSESKTVKAPDAANDAVEPAVVQHGDTLQFKSWPEKDIRIADYGSIDDLLGAIFKDSTMSLKRGDKVLVDDIRGSELFNGFALTPDVEGQFFAQALATATGGQTLERLRDTNDEVRLVAKETGAREADLFLRERASKANLYSTDLTGTRYLLFATHGFLGGDFSGIAEPALALSQTGDPQGYDGFLTMSEVTGLNLDAELVVLSACNTVGQGRKAIAGGGFAGLARSFMDAGADSLLVSHWSVDSQAARDLVTAFFEFKKKLPADEALSEAKQGVRSQSRQIGKQAGGLKMSQSHPFFWAPFIFVGVPGSDEITRVQ
jgi:ankyrin repeat protein/CHAT domain-containing protein